MTPRLQTPPAKPTDMARARRRRGAPGALAVLLVLAGLLAPAFAAAAGPGPASAIPVEHFVDLDAFGGLKISPDGKHYAATVPRDDTMVLVILRREDMKRTAAVAIEKKGIVGSFEWANDRQVVYTVATRTGPLDHPVANPYLYVVDVDGNPRPVHKIERMRLVHLLPKEEHEILVDFDGPRSGIGRIDLRTGKVRQQRVSWPNLSGVTYFLDNDQQVRAVLGYFANELNARLYLLDAAGEWQLVNDANQTDLVVRPRGFSRDNRLAYLFAERRSGPDEVRVVDLQTMQSRTLLQNPRVDPERVFTSPVHGGVIAVRFLDGKPVLEFVDPEDRHARELQKLVRAFPGAYVAPTSYALDGELGLYFVSSDVNSGEYYLVDHGTGKAQFVAATSERLDPRQMSPTTPIRFKARDGLEIEGFLTLPKDRPAGVPGPLVVMPHGGPIGISDAWDFDPEVQLLASRGYATLKVNFRGSGNYGRDFIRAGYRQWGRRMQDDLTDATLWAIENGHAARGRICLYGASYGGYASLMGLVREPGLYACGIGNVGVYNLPQLYREDSVSSRYMRTWLDQTLGSSGLDEISPPQLARAIKAPVLLGAGGDDPTAPPHHTRTMQKALRNAGVPVEAVVYDSEGHGYFDPGNRLDWANRVLAHLERTLGPAGPAGASAPASAAGE